MQRRLPHRPLAVALGLAVLVACSLEPALAPEPACEEIELAAVPRGVDLVIIVNDTMRRDRLGAYGGPARTPRFDAFAREHLRFDRAFSEAPWTLPAIATLFTSLYPSQHGVTSHPRQQSVAHGPLERELRQTDVLSEQYTTLAEVLRGAGYRPPPRLSPRCWAGAWPGVSRPSRAPRRAPLRSTRSSSGAWKSSASWSRAPRVQAPEGRAQRGVAERSGAARACPGRDH